jgi:AcrR family transcriptional regulator
MDATQRVTEEPVPAESTRRRTASTAARKKPRRADVPQTLVAVATQLFAERGFDNTSVQEIVDASGVTKGAMYHYFRSKDDILYEIYARVLRLQMDHLKAIVESDLPPAAKARAAASDVVETSVAALDDWVVFWQAFPSLSPDRQAIVREERREYHELFRTLLDDLRVAGLFRSDVPLDLVLDYFFGAVHYLGTWYRSSGPINGKVLGEYFAELLMSSGTA